MKNKNSDLIKNYILKNKNSLSQIENRIKEMASNNEKMPASSVSLYRLHEKSLNSFSDAFLPFQEKGLRLVEVLDLLLKYDALEKDKSINSPFIEVLQLLLEYGTISNEIIAGVINRGHSDSISLLLEFIDIRVESIAALNCELDRYKYEVISGNKEDLFGIRNTNTPIPDNPYPIFTVGWWYCLGFVGNPSNNLVPRSPKKLNELIAKSEELKQERIELYKKGDKTFDSKGYRVQTKFPLPEYRDKEIVKKEDPVISSSEEEEVDFDFGDIFDIDKNPSTDDKGSATKKPLTGDSSPSEHSDSDIA